MSFFTRISASVSSITQQLSRYYGTSPVLKASSNDTTALFNAIAQLNQHQIFLKNLPVVTILGPQSAGKTTLVSGICQRYLFPTGTGMTTMKPMHITTLRSPETKITVDTKKCFSDEEARSEIHRLNQNRTVPFVSIKIEGPDLQNNFFADMPGLVSAARENGSDLIKQIKTVNIAYLRNNNCIPVVVHPAHADPETNQAIHHVQKEGKMNSALVVISKVDMLGKKTFTNQHLMNLLDGRSFKFGYGCISVILNDGEESLASAQKARDIETKFRELNYPFGLNDVCKKLAAIQFDRIKDEIPVLLNDIDGKIAHIETSKSFFDSMLENDTSALIDRLSIMFEKLGSNSPELFRLQSELKEAIHGIFYAYYQERILNLEQPKLELTRSSKSIHPGVKQYHADHRTNPEHYTKNEFKELFSDKSLLASLVRETRLPVSYANESHLGALLSLFDFEPTDFLDKRAVELIKRVNSFVEELIRDDKVQIAIQKVIIDKLVEYVHDDLSEFDEKAMQFLRFMIEEIGEESFKSGGISSSIAQFIKSRKRPKADAIEMVRHIAPHYSKELQFTRGLFERFDDQKKISVPAFSPQWNVGFFGALTDQLVDHSFSVVAIDYLDTLLKKGLQKTVDLTQKDHIKNEKNKVQEQVAVLRNLRHEIARYSSSERVIENPN